VLDLGELFISDFPQDGQAGDRAPLDMVRCEDCTLVQTRHTVDPQRLYSHYWYKSGTNETMVAALRDVVHDALEHVVLDHFDTWLDIGANDGTLLNLVGIMPSQPVRRVGIDPAMDTKIERVRWINEAFPLGYKLPWKCKVITSIAQFYNVDDPHAYVQEIADALHADGIWVVQLQDLASVLRDRAFDYFCHEHLALYSLHSFERLIHEHGLEITDWSTNSVNGGSLRIIVQHGSKLTTSRRAEDDGAAWTAFGGVVDANKREVLDVLTRLRDQGVLVLGYGASTKGNTLLQYYGIGPELLPVVAERQAAKVGRRTVTGIPIVSEDEARAMRPDWFFALPWHFVEGFMRREATPFITALPHLTLHSQSGAKAA
jgi:hypothetical protein